MDHPSCRVMRIVRADESRSWVPNLDLIELVDHLAAALSPTPTKGLSLLMRRFEWKARVRAFWMNCESEGNHRRDQLRAPSAVMGDRLDELQEELNHTDWPEGLQKIDTTSQSILETIDVTDAFFEQGV